MHNTAIISAITLSLALVGCGDEQEKEPQTPVAPEVISPAPAVDTSDEPVLAGVPEQVQTISIAGNTYRVTVKGLIAPNAVTDVSIVQTSRTPAAATIRVWVGDESGVGSMKIKVHSHGARSHARPQAPSTLPENSAIWIEVQLADGTFDSGSIVIQ